MRRPESVGNSYAQLIWFYPIPTTNNQRVRNVASGRLKWPRSREDSHAQDQDGRQG